MAKGRKPGWDQPVGDAPDQHVGAHLRGLRKQAGAKQAEIADALGIDQSFISRIERGKQAAPERVIRYYADRFGAGDLLAGLTDIARAEARLKRRRSPLLIARQARYPLDGDESRFVSETLPDGTPVPCGAIVTKTWTIRNSGTVPWRGRRLRRIGETTGPWTLTSARFTAVPDTEPGDTASISVQLKTPHMETAAVAHWKMVDADDLLYFRDRYSVGLGVYLLVGHQPERRPRSTG